MRFRAFDEKGTGFWTQLEYVANLWGISLQQPAQVMLINPRGCSAAWVWNSSKQRHFFKFSVQIQSTLSMLNKNWYILVLPSDMFSERSLNTHQSINKSPVNQSNISKLPWCHVVLIWRSSCGPMKRRRKNVLAWMLKMKTIYTGLNAKKERKKSLLGSVVAQHHVKVSCQS